MDILSPTNNSSQSGLFLLFLHVLYCSKSQVKQSSNPMGLLVIDAESDTFYRQRGVKVTAVMADASWVPFAVRKLAMVRRPDGYGFLLKEEKCRSGKRGEGLFQPRV